MYPETFEGFSVTSHENWSDLKKTEFKPKTFEDHDVDIVIEACGVCGSDLHTITGGWGPQKLPLCVGHEIIGKVIKAGSKVTLCKVGDRVGVGAQVGACLKCKVCKSDNENYCPHMIHTYSSPYPDGTIAQGGYSSHIRAHEYFTFPIPEEMDSAVAAPLMCAGLTVFGPMHRAKVGPGMKVAVLGIGGLGHLGLQFARALGAEVYALSHSPHKKDDAIKCGAQHFIVTSEPEWYKPWQYTFDFILNTADVTHTFNMVEYISTLNINGTFHNVGLPDEPLPEMRAFHFLHNGASITGSHIGSRPEMLRMLEVATEKDVKPWVETIQIGEEGCKEALERLKKNKVHFRFTFTGYDKAFPDRTTSA